MENEIQAEETSSSEDKNLQVKVDRKPERYRMRNRELSEGIRQ